MALGSSYAKNLARKAPAEPDVMLALGEEPDTDESEPDADDEDADEAQLQSAYEDFARAAGITKSPATLRALQEIIRLTK